MLWAGVCMGVIVGVIVAVGGVGVGMEGKGGSMRVLVIRLMMGRLGGLGLGMGVGVGPIMGGLGSMGIIAMANRR